MNTFYFVKTRQASGCEICGAAAKEVVKGNKNHHPVCRAHFRAMMDLKAKKRLS